MKVWQSYLEKNTPGAGRIFWVYGPGREEITVIGVEPHPEDKKSAGYQKAMLSAELKRLTADCYRLRWGRMSVLHHSTRIVRRFSHSLPSILLYGRMKSPTSSALKNSLTALKNSLSALKNRYKSLIGIEKCSTKT